MKLYLKEGNILKFDNNISLEILNLEEFLKILKENSTIIPAPHFIAKLNYKLIIGKTEYYGTSSFDTYKGINNQIDNECPYIVELKNWNLSNNNLDKYFEFNLIKKS